MLSDNVDYQDFGGDYLTKPDPDRAIRHIIRHANLLCFDPIPDVA